jgi:hypothetical protein
MAQYDIAKTKKTPTPPPPPLHPPILKIYPLPLLLLKEIFRINQNKSPKCCCPLILWRRQKEKAATLFLFL